MVIEFGTFNSDLIIYIVTIFTGLLSVVTSIYLNLNHYWDSQKKKKMATEENLESALKSNDLHILGNSLENIIGNFNVYEYVTDSNISNKIDRYVEKLSSFVGTDERIKTGTISEPPINSDFKKSEFMVCNGKYYNNKNFTKSENWNALAKLRRDIEIFLNEIAKEKGLNLPNNISAGTLLKILTQKDIIPESAYNNLKYSISVANKAIHGLDVDIEEANEAILHANYAIELIKRNKANKKN